MIYEKVLDENQKLEMQIRSIQTQLKKFPEGKLISASNGKGNKWYWSDGHKPSYVQKACSKIQLYASNGIIPSVQLITTYEAKANPLSSQMDEKIVEYYFL